MITLYLKKAENNSVVAFRSINDKLPVACWASTNSNKPDKRYKYVMFNCYRYKIQWI